MTKFTATFQTKQAVMGVDAQGTRYEIEPAQYDTITDREQFVEECKTRTFGDSGREDGDLYYEMDANIGYISRNRSKPYANLARANLRPAPYTKGVPGFTAPRNTPQENAWIGHPLTRRAIAVHFVTAWGIPTWNNSIDDAQKTGQIVRGEVLYTEWGNATCYSPEFGFFRTRLTDEEKKVRRPSYAKLALQVQEA